MPPRGRGLHQDDLYLVGMQLVDSRVQFVPALVEGVGGLTWKGPDINEDVGVTALRADIIAEQHAAQPARLALRLHALAFFPSQIVWLERTVTVCAIP